MTPDFERLSSVVLDLTDAVGSGQMNVSEALVRLESSVAECCDLEGITAIWQIIWMASEVVALLVPEKKDIVLMRGDGRKGDKLIPVKLSIRLMLNVILWGMERHYAKGNRSKGASELLALCPNPIPTDSPYDDSEEVTWDTREFGS
jgi:hypothetical protein